MTRSGTHAMARARAGGGPTWRSTLALAGVLCAGGTSWLVLIHHASGARERREPPLGIHVLRDAATALPAVLVGVILACASRGDGAREGLRQAGTLYHGHVKLRNVTTRYARCSFAQLRAAQRRHSQRAPGS